MDVDCFWYYIMNNYTKVPECIKRSHLSHCGPQPVTVSGLGKKSGRQRHWAAPFGPTLHLVLGPHGVGWHGSILSRSAYPPWSNRPRWLETERGQHRQTCTLITGHEAESRRAATAGKLWLSTEMDWCRLQAACDRHRSLRHALFMLQKWKIRSRQILFGLIIAW